MNRYRITVTVERLRDVENHTNPNTGKVEEFNRQVGPDGPWVAVVPDWTEVAKFGGYADGDTFREAKPEVLRNLGENFLKIDEMADLIDQD